MWDRLESMFRDGTGGNRENEKKRKKNKNNNKSIEKQEAQPQESHSSSAHDSIDDERRSENRESKGININDFLSIYKFDDLYLYHVEAYNEYESVNKGLRP